MYGGRAEVAVGGGGGRESFQNDPKYVNQSYLHIVRV